MRLSEAIKLGAMLSPQGFGQNRDSDGHTCALGAAGDAIGVDAVTQSGWSRLASLWPLLSVQVSCPATGKRRRVDVTIVNLNDAHRWSRERIAGWLETLEQAQAVQSTELAAVTSRDR